jgi:hypothetical protein
MRYAPSSTRKRRSTNYQNVILESETYYSVFQRTFKSAVSGEMIYVQYSVETIFEAY